jgi:ADP-ribose pyrophosphatase YjhB (NUDIX family)
MLKEMSAGLIFDNNKILLVKNDKHGSPRYEPPGGKKESNETFEECAIREIKEELGIDVEIYGLLGIYETDSPEGKFAVHTYLCKIKKGIPKPLVHEFGWYSFNDMLQLKEKGTLVPNLCSALKEIKVKLK